MERKVAFSLIQPSGDLTIGNYLGAIKSFVKMQNEYECFFGVANLHAITVTQVAADLRRRSLEVIAYIVAAGVKPEKATLFIQSQVPEHAELAWVLNSISSIGQLQRMTQFKDKAQKHADNLNAALLTYPVLMAADILLYQSHVVPVGADQKQHLEFTRDLAERFNSRYSPTFTVPEPLTDENATRIMSLKDPSSKMSKSDPDENAYILIKDDPATIRRKIARAVTDSEANFCYQPEQAGLMNLINLYAAYAECTPKDVVERFHDSDYATFKRALGDLIVETMEPIRQRFLTLMADKKELEAISRDGALAAQRAARRTLFKVYRKVGLLQ
ncbi:tryptophan--tRNA ligase [Murdochiella sp. Marseille-P8839]|nr:tryptophan--tRNA ligase [Murdochiella sp. Marseille-P8839]